MATSNRKFIVAGNWKMNGTISSVTSLLDGLAKAPQNPSVQVIIAPPSIYLTLARQRLPDSIGVAAQNVFNKPNGAYTGEISVEQLKDAGIEWSILGHSERRTVLQEDDKFVGSKVKAVVDGGLSAIVCCGESLEQREKDETIRVVTTQLQAVADAVGKDWSKIVIAYEPIWAIGTGKVASTQQAQEAHEAIRKWLSTAISEKAANETRILYGGSVSEKNCHELSQQRDVDGFLVGGASLKPAFHEIMSVKR